MNSINSSTSSLSSIGSVIEDVEYRCKPQIVNLFKPRQEVDEKDFNKFVKWQKEADEYEEFSYQQCGIQLVDVAQLRSDIAKYMLGKKA